MIAEHKTSRNAPKLMTTFSAFCVSRSPSGMAAPPVEEPEPGREGAMSAGAPVPLALLVSLVPGGRMGDDEAWHCWMQEETFL